MTRYPFIQVPDRPPYIARLGQDHLLKTAADDAHFILLLIGDGAGMGVSRTLKAFVEQIPLTLFNGNNDRIPVVFDLYGGNACRYTVEVLVMIRNALVTEINKTVGTSNIGTYLFPFDALYTIWLGQQKIDPQLMVKLTPTKRGKVGRRVAKLAVTIASFGTLHILGGIAEIADLAKDVSWETSDALDFAREQGVETLFDRKVIDAERFIHRYIAPRVSSRLHAVLDDRELTPHDIWMLMYEMLVDATLSIQSDIERFGRLIYLVDAIDEANDHDPERIRIRSAITGLMLSSRIGLVAGVLSGRAPAQSWVDELKSQDHKIELLTDIPSDDIRRAFKSVGLEHDEIELILREAGLPSVITAANLSSACKRLAVTWPNVKKTSGAKPIG